MKRTQAAMLDLTERVRDTLERKNLLPPDQTVVVAVSGGLDSTVLLRLLHSLSERFRWHLVVAHFNHQLRGAESEGDATFVRRLARHLGLRFVGGEGDVRRLARCEGISIEMAARRLRHEFLATTAADQGSCRVALAHHAGDQVETFFLRLLRGGGGDGLAGMRPEAPSPANAAIRLVRPLLDISRAELEEFAWVRRLRWREDTSNQATDAERNRLRQRALPWLRGQFRSAIDPAVLRAMNVIGAEADLAAELARTWLARRRRVPFDQLHVAVQRRVILTQLVGFGLSPGFDAIDRLRREVGAQLTLGPGTLVSRDPGGALHVGSPAPPAFDPTRLMVELSAASGSFRFGALRVQWRRRANPGPWRPDRPAARGAESYDADRVGETVILRHWKPGDRFQPIGSPSPAKLQDLFTNEKVPRAERHRRAIATTAAGKLFWVEGLRIAEEFKLRPDTRQRLDWASSRP